MAKRIALVQLWLGEIPDYFKYHYQTCINLEIDFFFFTDQDIDAQFNSPNFKFIKTNIVDVEARLENLTGKKLRFDTYYKLNEIKPAYCDLFQEYFTDYDFVGWYDIDTLLGDVRAWVEPFMDEFDVISFGEHGSVYDRISGPFGIMRNIKEVREVYLNDPVFYECMEKSEYSGYDEDKVTQTLRSLGIPVKIIFESSNLDINGHKIGFDAMWTGGKVYCNGKERLLHHFIRKTLTTFEQKGSAIFTRQKMQYEEDFYFVTYFTENYEPILRTLIKSIENYSNHRCILYTVNYTSQLVHQLSDQFIVRRIDITGDDWLDGRGRSFNTITCKPIIQLESLRAFPGNRFVFLDADIYVTVNIDDIAKYFKDLENYPLTNSHVHDVIYCIETGTHVSSLHILGDVMGVPIKIFPRRKANIMLYDERSKWFFEEQMEIYHTYKDTKIPGIFKYHDEDLFNVILSKYDFKKSLPVVDIEEVYEIDITRMLNYSYSETAISEFAVVPKNDRDVYIFHGYKSAADFQRVDDNYSPTVINKSDMLMQYNGKDLVFIKNSYLGRKRISPLVQVRISHDGNTFFTANWNIFTSMFFYAWDIPLQKGQKYIAEIIEPETGRLIYRNEITLV